MVGRDLALLMPAMAKQGVQVAELSRKLGGVKAQANGNGIANGH